MGHWPAREQELKDLWAIWGAPGRVAKEMGVTKNTIIGKSRRMGLQFHGKAVTAAGMSADHPAAVRGVTRYASKVVDPYSNVPLKPGEYQRKLGSVVTKGRWKGMAIYSLTLEERATCPRSCSEWLTCYGNNMHNAKRMKAGLALESRLEGQMRQLQAEHPRGFVVRLHVLGDFYSVEYVKMWLSFVRAIPQLHIFGYTHREPSDPIGAAIEYAASRGWDRFAIRRSDHAGQRGAVVIDKPEDRGDAIICPAQTSSGRTCATCGLCWNSQKPIAFLRH
jgi:hypothetical protein